MEIKKNPNRNLEQRRSLFFFIGLTLALGSAIFAFEWRSEMDPLVDLGTLDADPFDELEILSTVQPPPPKPPKPKVTQIEIEEVDDDIEIEEPKVDFDTDFFDEPVEDLFVEEPDEPVIEIFTGIVEEMPEPKGGYGEFYQFLSKNMKYPKKAQRMGIEGRVFVQFVVNEDGAISDIEVIKGMGVGCDEEAIRVLSEAPAWNPGKQRGRAVKVRMVIPVMFRLN